MAAHDFYSTLGVPRDASQKDIRAAYRKLARKFHPDVNRGQEDAEATFKKINEAYQVLSNDKTRRDYDEFGENWRHADQIRAAGVGAGRTGRGRGTGPGGVVFEWSSAGDTGGFGGFEDFFSNLGGFGRRAGRGVDGFDQPRQRQPAPQEVEVEVTLAEAFRGSTRLISYERAEPCSGCGGAGVRSGVMCAICGGAGMQARPVRLEVKVPAGIEDGGRVRVRPDDGTAITLKVRIRPDPIFRREGSDLYTEVKVPYLDAVLGGEVEAPTMAGKVMLKIPPGTQNGRSFRLAGKGMPKLGGKGQGSLYVIVRAVLPERLTDDERDLFERLRAMSNGRRFSDGAARAAGSGR